MRRKKIEEIEACKVYFIFQFIFVNNLITCFEIFSSLNSLTILKGFSSNFSMTRKLLKQIVKKAMLIFWDQRPLFNVY